MWRFNIGPEATAAEEDEQHAIRQDLRTRRRAAFSRPQLKIRLGVRFVLNFLRISSVRSGLTAAPLRVDGS